MRVPFQSMLRTFRTFKQARLNRLLLRSILDRNVDQCHLALKRGADPNMTFPLHSVGYTGISDRHWTALQLLILDRHPANGRLVRLLSEHGGDLDRPMDRSDYTALMFFILNADTDGALAMVRCGADLYRHNTGGQTALDLIDASFLIRSGADVLRRRLKAAHERRMLKQNTSAPRSPSESFGL